MHAIPHQPTQGARTTPDAPAANAANPPNDTAAVAEGRRILSTAFVRVGPDGHMTIELRNGQVAVIRDVALHAKDFCGQRIVGDSPPARYCGSYAEVVAARPGGAVSDGEPDLVTGIPIDPPHSPTEHNNR